MTVHAHPDDEASKGPATVAKAAAEGFDTVLVCCTGGEQGDILNPAMDEPAVRDRLHEVRMEELAASVEVIGYGTLELLGYRDSGMPDTPANEDPRCFARAEADEAVGRLVALIRRYQPHVLITYSDDQAGYPHPDHLRVHDISVAAFEAAGDPDAFPDPDGPGPWQPLKLYYSVWSKARMLAMHAKFEELGLESPFSKEWLDRPSQDERITTQVDIGGFAGIRQQALLAHKTQIDPDSPFWFGIPAEEAAKVHPFDEYVLARSLVDTDRPEDDVFAGLREHARSA